MVYSSKMNSSVAATSRLVVSAVCEITFVKHTVDKIRFQMFLTGSFESSALGS